MKTSTTLIILVLITVIMLTGCSIKEKDVRNTKDVSNNASSNVFPENANETSQNQEIFDDTTIESDLELDEYEDIQYTDEMPIDETVPE